MGLIVNGEIKFILFKLHVDCRAGRNLVAKRYGKNVQEAVQCPAQSQALNIVVLSNKIPIPKTEVILLDAIIGVTSYANHQ